MRYPGLLFVGLLCSVSLQAAEYFVSPDGDDSNKGTKAAPFATIQRAADRMRAGDTCFIRGGRYHEEVVANRLLGKPSKPIRFVAYENERVILDGSRSLADLGADGWTLHSLNIFKTRLDTDIWQLYADDELLMPARWPNANFEDGSVWDWKNRWARGDEERSRNGVLFDERHAHADLAASGLDVTGALAILNVGSFRTWTRRVLSHAAGEASFRYEKAATYRPVHHHYFLEGKLSFLDTDKEWFYDPKDRMLYLWSESGEAPLLDVRGKVQTYALRISKSRNVVLKGLEFFGTTFKFEDSESVRVEDCELIYPSCSKRVLGDVSAPEATRIAQAREKDPSHSVVRNCTFYYPESHAIFMRGEGNRIENCLFEGIDWVVSELPVLQSSVYMRGPNSVFVRNTVETAGASEFLDLGTTPLVEYNRFINYGRVQNDGAAVQLTIGAQPGSVTRFNWFHDAVKYGARFDAPIPPVRWGKMGLMHHNVGWNVPSLMMLKGELHQCYANTSLKTSKNGIVILDDSDVDGGANLGSVTRNNLATKLSGHRARVQELPGVHGNNWNGYMEESDIGTQLRDPRNLDFRPIAGATIVDGGLLIPGVVGAFSGDAPDIGAYESGAENYWIPGRRIKTASTPIPPNGSRAVKLDADLMWLEGLEARSHRIYLGTDPDHIEFQGEQGNNVFDPGALDPDSVYYWRVDEVTPKGLVEGEVWSFTTVSGM